MLFLQYNTYIEEPKAVRPTTQAGKYIFFKLLERTHRKFIESDKEANIKFKMSMNKIIHNFNISFLERKVSLKNSSKACYKTNNNACFKVELRIL